VVKIWVHRWEIGLGCAWTDAWIRCVDVGCGSGVRPSVCLDGGGRELGRGLVIICSGR
jgi:hypothetical protein